MGWVYSDFQQQFAHQGTMKTQEYFLVENVKSTLHSVQKIVEPIKD